MLVKEEPSVKDAAAIDVFGSPSLGLGVVGFKGFKGFHGQCRFRNTDDHDDLFFMIHAFLLHGHCLHIAISHHELHY